MKRTLKRRVKRHIKDPGHRLLARQLRRQWVPFVLTVVFAFTGALFEGVGLGLLIPFIESLTSPDAEPFRIGIGWIDQYVLMADADTATRLYWVSGLIMASIAIRCALNYLSKVTSTILTGRISLRTAPGHHRPGAGRLATLLLEGQVRRHPQHAHDRDQPCHQSLWNRAFDSRSGVDGPHLWSGAFCPVLAARAHCAGPVRGCIS